MIGIQICGLNGCGKSTLARVLAGKLGFYCIDNEDLYFTRNEEDAPYARPRSRAEAKALLLSEIENHGNFVFAAVTGDHGPEVTACISHVVRLRVPREIRLRRVRARSLQKFGARMLPGGDLYDQEESFFKLVEAREEALVDDWIRTLTCPVIETDGTGPVEEIAASILRQLGGLCDTVPPVR